eukprot:CAMPEP_0178550754 /NCGR_PEP_ID=MMETSP0697-20121206/6423_1 /TAXON_ID=265572 /ORGANISM="Extubocellulus spinifer, Strain CCMP396" /LENGTH=572 /DNA_ID=CAMNT_0020183567 /DNA_START=937 /DNA_END=2656 /DNA_ORIENTATION=+
MRRRDRGQGHRPSQRHRDIGSPPQHDWDRDGSNNLSRRTTIPNTSSSSRHQGSEEHCRKYLNGQRKKFEKALEGLRKNLSCCDDADGARRDELIRSIAEVEGKLIQVLQSVLDKYETELRSDTRSKRRDELNKKHADLKEKLAALTSGDANAGVANSSASAAVAVPSESVMATETAESGPAISSTSHLAPPNPPIHQSIAHRWRPPPRHPPTSTSRHTGCDGAPAAMANRWCPPPPRTPTSTSHPTDCDGAPAAMAAILEGRPVEDVVVGADDNGADDDVVPRQVAAASAAAADNGSVDHDFSISVNSDDNNDGGEEPPPVDLQQLTPEDFICPFTREVPVNAVHMGATNRRHVFEFDDLLKAIHLFRIYETNYYPNSPDLDWTETRESYRHPLTGDVFAYSGGHGWEPPECHITFPSEEHRAAVAAARERVGGDDTVPAFTVEEMTARIDEAVRQRYPRWVRPASSDNDESAFVDDPSSFPARSTSSSDGHSSRRRSETSESTYGPPPQRRRVQYNVAGYDDDSDHQGNSPSDNESGWILISNFNMTGGRNNKGNNPPPPPPPPPAAASVV